MKNNKVLFIVTAFSPENAVGAIRTTKIVKYLIRNNYNVTVISPKLHEGSKIDFSNECDELEIVNRIIIPQSPFFEKIFLNKRNKLLQKKSATSYIESNNAVNFISKIKSHFFICIHFLYTLLRNIDWSKNVKRYVSKNIELSNFDSVISSYPSLSSHWIAYHLSKKDRLFWIADFRDPINYEANSNAVIKKINTYFQNRIIKQANFITSISNDLLLKFNPKNIFSPNKLVCIPNGFDPEDLNNQDFISNNIATLKLCYVGSLYGGKRDLSILFKVIRELIDEEKIHLENIEIVYAGGEFNVIEEQSNRFKLADILKNEGYVSRLESMKIQSFSDLTIIATWNTEIDKGILTGKLYECLLTKKMILGIVNGTVPNSELKKVVKYINGGIVYEQAAINQTEDYLAFKKYIFDKYNEKQKTYNLKESYNSNINNYNYSEITNSFINLMNTNL